MRRWSLGASFAFISALIVALSAPVQAADDEAPTETWLEVDFGPRRYDLRVTDDGVHEARVGRAEGVRIGIGCRPAQSSRPIAIGLVASVAQERNRDLRLRAASLALDVRAPFATSALGRGRLASELFLRYTSSLLVFDDDQVRRGVGLGNGLGGGIALVARDVHAYASVALGYEATRIDSSLPGVQVSGWVYGPLTVAAVGWSW